MANATVVYSTNPYLSVVSGGEPTVGPQLIVNPIIAGDGTPWILGSGWFLLSPGAAPFPAPVTTTLSQSIATLENSKTYRVTLAVSQYGEGSIRVVFDGAINTNGTANSGNGTFTEELTVNAAGNITSIIIDPNATPYAGKITLVSVREVL